MNNIIENLILSGRPIILKFEANWCTASRRLEVDMMKVFPLYEKDIDLMRINVEVFPNLLDKYNINVLPTLLFFKDKKLVKTIKGYITPEEFEQVLKEILS